jgi:REP-associated tyrosine transposase
MARPLRPEAAGGTFHLTARATWGRRLFLTDEDREDFLAILTRVVRRYRWECLGWCLMGTHYHLLVHTPAPNLGNGMRDLNGTYARRLNHRHGHFGSVLAERYSDRVIRSDEHFVNALQYIALNPVHAGLVRRPEQWRWSSHAALAGLVRRPLALAARGALRRFRGKREDYRSFVDSCAGLGSRVSRAAAAGSGTSHTTASGGSVTSAEKGWSFQRTASASTPKPLPTSEPP